MSLLGMLLMLLLLRGGRAEDVMAECWPNEYHCANGQCVEGVRFCDGNSDCEDGSDEPDGCTNCNRTYYGLLDVKYPLRLSESIVHRRLTSAVCSFSFVAAGGRYGDLVEVTFLSFQIGTFQLDSSTCSGGYMEVEDMRAVSGKRLRRRSIRPPRKPKKKASATKKEASKKRTTERTSHVGSFCGPMIGPRATFYSTSNRVKITVTLSTQVSGQSVVPRLYLTYRFLHRGTALPKHPGLASDTLPGTKCDVVLKDCHNPNCVIQSPNFPGFYLRNISCHYWIHQDSAPPGKVAQIEVLQKNEFKINLLSGHTNNDRYKPGILTSECAGDVIRVFDGRTSQSPLLAEFCGAGTLPVIRSSGPDMLIQLISVASQPLGSSRFELDVRVRFVPSSVFRMVSEKCSLTIDGTRHPFGILRIPDHSIPMDTTCSFRVFGKPNDRVWLYFVVYSMPDLDPWNDDEKCDVGKLEIIHPKSKFRHSHHHYHFPQQPDGQPTHSSSSATSNIYETYCEKRSPRQCGHASDFIDYVPSRPCHLPNESYLTPGPELILQLSFYKAMAIHGSSPHFVARYEVIQMEETNAPELCVFTIHSRDGASGTVEAPRNLFLYGRGGASNLHCKYDFKSSPQERVRITVSQIHFWSSRCSTAFNPIVQRHNCDVVSRSSRHAILNITEAWNELQMFIGCVCDSETDKAIVFESIGPHVSIDFKIHNMGPRDDFRTFLFVLKYEFVEVAPCGTQRDVMSGIQGQLMMSYPSAIRCRWLLAALPSRALYITVKGYKHDTVCKNKILFYSIDSQQPYSVFCASDGDSQESFFSLSWRSSSRDSRHRYSPDLTIMELLANESGRIQVQWLEVTRPSTESLQQDSSTSDGLHFQDPCPLECPELEACISPDLSCDGTNHCPASAVDESPERCVQFPMLTVAVSCATAVVLVVIIVLGIIVWKRIVRVNKSVIPPPDLFRNNCKESSIKGPVR